MTEERELIYLDRDLELREATDDELHDYSIVYNLENVPAKIIILRDDMMGEGVIIKDISNIQHQKDFENLYNEQFILISEIDIYAKDLKGKYIVIEV